MCKTRIEFREALGVRTRPRVAFQEAANLQRHFHSIIRDAYLDTTVGGDVAELRENFALVASDDFRAAMSDNGAVNALFLAPRELCPNRRVTD